MSWDAALFGKLRFPAKGLAAWKKRDVDPRSWEDWPEDLVVPEAPSTVGAILADLGGGVEQTATELTVRVSLPEDDYREKAAELAAAFRLAAGDKATGKLYLVGGAGAERDFGWLVTVGSGAESLEELVGKDLARAYRDPLYKTLAPPALEEAVAAAVAAVDRRLGEGTRAAPSPRHERVMAHLAKLPPDELHAKLKRRAIELPTPKGARPAHQLYPDGAELLEALRGARTAELHACALELLGRVAPEAGRELALEVLADAASPAALAIGAVAVLAAKRKPDDEALAAIARALLRVDDPPASPGGRARAILVDTQGDADAHVIAILGDALAPFVDASFPEVPLGRHPVGRHYLLLRSLNYTLDVLVKRRAVVAVTRLRQLAGTPGLDPWAKGRLELAADHLEKGLTIFVY